MIANRQKNKETAIHEMQFAFVTTKKLIWSENIGCDKMRWKNILPTKSTSAAKLPISYNRLVSDVPTSAQYTTDFNDMLEHWMFQYSQPITACGEVMFSVVFVTGQKVIPMWPLPVQTCSLGDHRSPAPPAPRTYVNFFTWISPYRDSTPETFSNLFT